MSDGSSTIYAFPGTSGPASEGAGYASYGDMLAAQDAAYAHTPPDPEQARSLSRRQVQQMRRLEAEGVPFFLHRTGIEAKVRALSLSDKAMLRTLPPYLQGELSKALNANSAGNQKNKTFSDYVRSAENDEAIANVACVAGFLEPRLTLTEAEADRANDEGVWWVGDLHIDERKRYMQVALGNAGEEDLKRIAGFLDTRLAAADLG